MESGETNNILLSSIKDVIVTARQHAYKSNNVLLLNMYWQIGRLIVEDEQAGKSKAAYGKAVLKNISHHLTLEFGKGFDESNLRNIRQFYQAFPIRDALRHELSWTHYRLLIRIENEELRSKYMQYAIEGNWDTRGLQRNIRTQFVDRIIAPQKTHRPMAQNLVKDPYILELKTGELTHAAIGQMDMYVRMYNDLKAVEGDNPTIGIILCTEKDETIVKYSVLAENEQLFASKYRLYLPKEEELARLIESDTINFKLDNEKG